ncbi:MAG: hypothetical protein K9J06_02510 [Flavobacteriales bacterium]|nr:hypothetical protein [Flavobacteriales bacterium]
MDAKEENRFSALIEVQDFLNQNAAALTDVAQIGIQKLVLDSYIQGIVVNDGIATADTTGHAIAKGNARVALTSAALRLTRAAKTMALDTEDPILLKQADYTKSELDKKRDTELHVTCQQISDFVTPLVPALAGYRIAPAHLTVLDTNIATYYSTLPQPGGQKDQKVVAGRNVAELLSKSYSMLGTKMDAYLDLYLDDFPDLVEQYYLARAIDDNTGGGGGGGGGTAQEFSGTVPAMMTATAGPIAFSVDATVKLTSSGTVGLSFQLMSGAVPSGSPISVPPASNFQGKLSDMGPAGDSIVVNNSNPMPGDYTISIQ